MRSIAVCIPTRNDQNDTGKIYFPLVSLAMQTYQDFTIYIRDEGLRDIFADRNVRLVLNLLQHKNIVVNYLRTDERQGVAFARRDLYETIRGEPYLLWLDDDMIIEPDSLEHLVKSLKAHNKNGFVQGIKKELDPFRKYNNDINVLNGEEKIVDKLRIYFGDAAFLLMRSDALKNIDWDLITQYCVDGLGGEDVMMSLLVAQDWKGWGVPQAKGWHVSPAKERWNWEIHSDILQVEMLNGKVAPEILRQALPHLAEFIPDTLEPTPTK